MFCAFFKMSKTSKVTFFFFFLIEARLQAILQLRLQHFYISNATGHTYFDFQADMKSATKFVLKHFPLLEYIYRFKTHGNVQNNTWKELNWNQNEIICDLKTGTDIAKSICISRCSSTLFVLSEGHAYYMRN